MAIEERGATAKSGMRSRSQSLIPRLFQPIDNASIVFFRIAFGITSFFHIWGVLDQERVRNRYVDAPFLFAFPGLDWLKPLPGDWMIAVWFALAGAALLVMLGLFYTQAIIFFFIGHTYAIHLDQSIFWNHYYVVSLFAFLMIFIPANRAHSLDVVFRRVPAASTVPSWALWILRAQMGVTYFFAGVAKINSDWLDGRPMDAFLTGDGSFPFISEWLNERWLHLLLSWTGVGFDLLIVPLLLWRRTRVPAFIGVLVFHLTNSLFFDIEVFPWFAIVATALFFAPDWPRTIGLWNNDPPPDLDDADVPRNWRALTPRQMIGFAVLAIHFVIQIALPLRHYAYPGNVSWTTEGDLWAWRMLITDPRQESVFTLKSKATGRECVLNVTDFVGAGHTLKLGFRPDMMAQFGHRVADLYWQQNRELVSVHVYSRVSVNGHPWGQVVAPETDLATVPRFLHNDWVLTQDPPPPPVNPPPLPPCRP